MARARCIGVWVAVLLSTGSCGHLHGERGMRPYCREPASAGSVGHMAAEYQVRWRTYRDHVDRWASARESDEGLKDPIADELRHDWLELIEQIGAVGSAAAAQLLVDIYQDPEANWDGEAGLTMLRALTCVGPVAIPLLEPLAAEGDALALSAIGYLRRGEAFRI